MNLHALRHLGLTTQVFKTALAAAVSWQVAVMLLGRNRPYFAALAAILTIQVTIAESIERGGQRLLGIVGGITLSMLAVHLLGITPLSIGLLVLIGMASATALGFGPTAVSQVAISALLVLSLGGKPSYAAARLLDSALGAGIAVAVNALVVPPDATPDAARHLRRLATAVAAELRHVMETEGTGAERDLREARSFTKTLRAARKAMHLAEEGTRFSPLLRKQRARVQRLRPALTLLEHLTIEVRGIARSMEILKSVPKADLRRSLHAVLTATAAAIESYGYLVATPSPRASAGLHAALDKAERARRQAEQRLPELDHAAALSEAGSVISDLTKMAADIEAAERRS